MFLVVIGTYISVRILDFSIFFETNQGRATDYIKKKDKRRLSTTMQQLDDHNQQQEPLKTDFSFDTSFLGLF